MRFAVYRVMVLGAFWGITTLCALSSLAQTPPEHIEAYIQLVKADQEEKEGNFAEALKLLARGVELYGTVTREYPDWQPELVRYRIVQARNQMERLQGLIDADKTSVSVVEGEAATPSSPKDVTPAQDRQHLELVAERDALRQQVALLEKSLAVAQQELERREDFVAMPESAGAEAALREENERLASEVAIVNQQVERVLQDKMAIETDLTALAGRENALNTEIQELSRQLDRESDELNQLSIMMDELQAAHDALAGENERLTRALSEAAAVPPPTGQVAAREVDADALTILETENTELKREIDGLNRALERGSTNGDTRVLQSQNAALIEELRIFRNQLIYSEQKIRELERELNKMKEASALSP